MESRDGKLVTRARATSTLQLAARINALADFMRTGQWIRGKSSAVFAEQWGLTVGTVENDAAEAWRRVCHEANDAGKMRPTIAGTLAVSLAQAAEEREYKAVAALGDTLSKVVGARAPERHEHAVVVAQYEALPAGDKARWCRDRAAALLAEADRLEGVVRVLADAGDHPEP